MSTEESKRKPMKLLPVGSGFRPTDEELVDFYLKSKILGMILHKGIIPDINAYILDPWFIPAACFLLSEIQTYGPEWFFFSPLYKKYNRLQRTTNGGYWKPTGPDSDIKREATKEVIGTKKILVFHKGGGSGHAGINTGWVIHEYRLRMASLPANETIVLCRLKKKKGSDFPPQTKLNMLPELLSNQETGPMNMDVDDSSTGTGLHLSGPPNIMTSGAERSHFANNIASDVRNQQDDMIPEGSLNISETASACHEPSSSPVGYGFRPTDQELVDHYLKSKILGTESHEDIIPVIEAYKMDPWVISGSCLLLSEIQRDGPEYFFFTHLHKKFPKPNQVQRTTTAGYWAKSGPDREIKDEATEEVIGTKKTFVFKMRRGRGHADVNTGLVIHEYSACMDSAPTNKTYVLCRLKTNRVWFSPTNNNLNGMLAKPPSNQEFWRMNMDIDDFV